jgi:hypothetical protein
MAVGMRMYVCISYSAGIIPGMLVAWVSIHTARSTLLTVRMYHKTPLYPESNAASADDPYTHAKLRNINATTVRGARLFAPSFAKPQELPLRRPFFLVMRRPARVILTRSMILYPGSPSVCRHPSPTCTHPLHRGFSLEIPFLHA